MTELLLTFPSLAGVVGQKEAKNWDY